MKVATEVIDRFSKGTFPPALASLPGTDAYRSAWETTIKAAEDYNDPGRFTAFIGYEWTSNTGGNNLHRVVIYRDDARKAIQMEPLTTVKPLGSDNPRDLWKYLETYENKTGGRVLAIAHNGNLSNGIMFPVVESFSGKPIDREYAQTRIKWEPLYEATQIKGDGEAHKFLSPNDEFAGYEIWDKFNLNMSVPKKPEMLQYEYARSGLKIGLKLENDLGTNPYKFGMIGSTDSHTGLATAEEDNFFGKHSGTEPSAQRMSHPVGCFGENCLLGGRKLRPDMLLCGQKKIHARLCLKRWNAKRFTQPPARGCLSDSLEVGILTQKMQKLAVLQKQVIQRAFLWVAIFAKRLQGNLQLFWLRL